MLGDSMLGHTAFGLISLFVGGFHLPRALFPTVNLDISFWFYPNVLRPRTFCTLKVSSCFAVSEFHSMFENLALNLQCLGD